jgi:phosphatidylinositol-3-phosphatase
VACSQFPIDLQNGQLPNFSFVVPNLLNDAHDGSLARADEWLRINIGPLLSSPAFQPGGDGILIITFDESYDEDCRPSDCDGKGYEYGGRVATIIIGPRVKPGFSSTTQYWHHDLLKTISVALGVTAPGAADKAIDLGELFE